MSSKFIKNRRFDNKPQLWSDYMWSSPNILAEDKKEEEQRKEYRNHLAKEKERIEAIPLEKLSFRDLYVEPFIKSDVIDWVYSGKNFVFQFLSGGKRDKSRCLGILNGEITEYNRQDVKNDNGEITINGHPFILIRGWGNLTGSGAYNLKEEYACKIQDTLAEFIVEKLNN